MIVLGIDIGLSGAFAVVMDAQIIALEDLPVREKPGESMIRNEIDGKQLAFLLRERLGARLDETLAIVENVRGMRAGKGAKPQGSSSVFALGETAGTIRGVLETLGIPYRKIEPQSWKRWYGIVKDTNGAKAVAKVTDIFGPDPRVHLVKHHNRAEAALIGRYGWQKWA